MRNRLNEALKTAMKAKDQRRVSTLRLILAALKDQDIAARGAGDSKPIGDDEVLQMLTKMVRQRRDSIRMYEEAGRVDLAEQEQEEIDVIQDFLPRQLSEEEVREAAVALIEELGAAGLKDMGRTMAELKKRYAGRLDPGKASSIIKSLLT